MTRAEAAEAAGAAGAAGGACPAAIRRALAGHTTMTLAYADEDGPQACAVLYAASPPGADGGVDGAADGAADGGTNGGADGGADAGPALYFVSATTTRHGRALAQPGARVAFTMQKDGQEWSGLTGLQGRGGCRPLIGAEWEAGWRIYTERFPFVVASEQLRAALERTALWELRPDWLRLIDNGQGFGHKEEWKRTPAPGAR
ncbi:pyridoxamine 5'-phosphate oxidase [Streptomyces piniterrae]|uniref:Pyridoxamine 5'-phosphate oxidase n=1 Tax=Streptomyces piniterrae TaxID=2571125 RepID=A0A4U0MPZ0_9ACTN|nr:pyridoxamine 5'-phosphate oxidase [Streptomyces piniterrae]